MLKCNFNKFSSTANQMHLNFDLLSNTYTNFMQHTVIHLIKLYTVIITFD